MLASVEGLLRAAEGDGFVLPGPEEADLKVILRGREEVNSHGYRDRPRALARTEGVARVAVLGDSVTFGQGVAMEQAFPWVAEEALEGVEVLNLGQSGFDIQQVVAMARHRLGVWKPDLVVYAFHTNDRVETRYIRAGRRARPLHVGTELSGWLASLRAHSALVRLSLGARAARNSAVLGTDEQASFFDRWAPRLVEAVGETPLVVFTVPHHRLAAEDCPSWSGDAAACRASQEALSQANAVFQALGVPVVPGLPALRRVDVDALVLPHDPFHPSAEGHRVLGQALAEDLRGRLSPARSE